MQRQPTRGRREVHTRSGTAAPPPTWTSVTGWPTSWTWSSISSSLTTSRSWGLTLEASRVSSSQDESSLLPTVPFRGVMTSETCGDYRSSSILLLLLRFVYARLANSVSLVCEPAVVQNVNITFVGKSGFPRLLSVVASERNYFRIKIPICFYVNFIYSNNW